MKITNTTIQNKTKGQKLQSSHFVPRHHVDTDDLTHFLTRVREIKAPKDQVIYSIGIKLLSGNTNENVQSFLNEYEIEPLEIPDIPIGVFDLLGSVYQYLNSKMENLKRGIFYTGKEPAVQMTKDLVFDSGQVLFDPSCGSGSFLFRSEAPPAQLVGVDADPIGVMICKFNYFIKFPEAPPPRIYNSDFFSWYRQNSNLRFEYIIGNPPFGANLDISELDSKYIISGESFSYFVEFGFQLLAQNGTLRYIVPDSLLNVKRHTDVRDFILEKTNLSRIVRLTKKFAGVMSDVLIIELNRKHGNTTLFEGAETVTVDRNVFKKLKNHIFVCLSAQDIEIIEKVSIQKTYDLSKSIFGLGVVTGNNAEFLFEKPGKGREPIFTGKEITKYKLLEPSKFILYRRDELQQVAPDEIYRANSKLIYKTICKTLRFAIDTNGALTTNSANIVIPNIPGYGPYTVLAFLNSDLYSFLYLKLFGGVNKIGKEHLMALPFPELSPSLKKMIDRMSKSVVKSGADVDLQRFIHKEVFNLTNEEILYIQKVANSIS